MDSVQVGKAVFVKVSFASLGFEPRTVLDLLLSGELCYQYTTD